MEGDPVIVDWGHGHVEEWALGLDCFGRLKQSVDSHQWEWVTLPLGV